MSNESSQDFPPVRRRVYLLRHGEVSYFDEAGKPVPPATVPLNEEGRRQAAAAAEVLAGLPIDRVVASPLRRCIETATIATKPLKLDIEQRADLREIEPGHLRSIPAESIREVFIGAFSSTPTHDTSFLGGETFGSMLGRVLPTFDALLADRSWKQMVVVAHGAVNRGILTRALGSGLAGFGSIEQDACCINVLDFDGAGRAVVRLINFTPYNPAKIGLELTTMERLFLQYRPG